MPLSPRDIERLIFGGEFGVRRYTQDSPIYLDVWLKYRSVGPQERIDLLLTPNRRHTTAELLTCLRERLQEPSLNRAADRADRPWKLANSGNAVAANLSFPELIRVVLPLTRWWQTYLWDENDDPTPHLLWLRQVAGAVRWSQAHAEGANADLDELQATDAFSEAYEQLVQGLEPKEQLSPYLWSVSLNRQALLSLTKSVTTTKADASRRLFDIDGKGISWAVIDSGIDATHRAFRQIDAQSGQPFADPGMESSRQRRPNRSRVVATYDFTGPNEQSGRSGGEHRQYETRFPESTASKAVGGNWR